MQINEQDIQAIVQRVMNNIGDTIKTAPHEGCAKAFKPAIHTISVNETIEETTEWLGVYEQMSDAIQAADHAWKAYVKNYQLRDREKLINSIRSAILREKQTLARMVYEETGLGRYEDKVAKHELAATATPGIEDLKTTAFSGDDGLTLVELAPYGVVGAVTPVTNPTETIINNAISLLAAGNAAVFNVHPSAKKSSAYVISLINQAIVEAGGPNNLVTMVKTPTLETIDELINCPKIKMLLGTGGPGLVKKLLSSGKKAVGAGAGNPPVVVDATADLENAAKSILLGASFDNNILCIAEKSVFVLDEVADDLIYHMISNGSYMLNQKELDDVMSFALVPYEHPSAASSCSVNVPKKYHAAKDWVGKDASLFLKNIGVQAKDDVKLLICDVTAQHPLVATEQMMPVLPIVRVKTLDEAIHLALIAEGGNRHTAIMHSRNVNNLTRFAQASETTIFVKNAASLAGVGYGGEGFATMTIAGPTGEGLTSAKSFTRQRRCVLAEGGFRII